MDSNNVVNNAFLANDVAEGELGVPVFSIIGLTVNIMQIIGLVVGVILIIAAIISAIKKKKFGMKLAFGLVFYMVSVILGSIKRFKPIIYIYPQRQQKIKIKVKYPEKLICTYPKYHNQWEVIANPDGNLEDCQTKRKLYALYWEGKRTQKPKIEKGFCIKGEDSSSFLEEKLAQLGLNEREAEEFIVYWLPQLEKNKYNLIKFELTEEINKDMPLEITPAPDTLIRISIVFQKASKYIEIEPQEFHTPERKGFTVVEWGGTGI